MAENLDLEGTFYKEGLVLVKFCSQPPRPMVPMCLLFTMVVVETRPGGSLTPVTMLTLLLFPHAVLLCCLLPL